MFPMMDIESIYRFLDETDEYEESNENEVSC